MLTTIPGDAFGAFRRTGRTTRLLEHAINAASRGIIEKKPEWWRYLLAWTLAIISFGFFNDNTYLERHTIRRRWQVFFVIANSGQLRSVQSLLVQIMDKRQFNIPFQENGHVLDFRYFNYGGLLKIVPLCQVQQEVMGRRDCYVVFDHYALESNDDPNLVSYIRAHSQLPPWME